MSNVEAEVDAVRRLRVATGTYAERVRAAVEATRRELAVLDARLSAGVDRYRGNANRAQQALNEAREQLASSPPEERAGASSTVSAAQQAMDNALRLLDRARAAQTQGAQASSALVRALQQVASVVDQHNSAASLALGELDKRLAELTATPIGERFGHAAKTALGTVVVAVEVASTVANLSAPVVAASQQAGPADPSTTIAQMTEAREAGQLEALGEYVAGIEERRFDATGGTGRWNPDTTLIEGETRDP